MNPSIKLLQKLLWELLRNERSFENYYKIFNENYYIMNPLMRIATYIIYAFLKF